jgi:Predicted pyrophosphatase
MTTSQWVATGRSDRQHHVHNWCVAAFGDDHARSIEQRGIRLAEEAIEAAQASGCKAEMVHRLVDHIYGKPVGELDQELGGVGVTLLALAHAAGIDADDAEAREVARIMSKPLEHFSARNAAKNAAGFNVLPDGARDANPAPIRPTGDTNTEPT